MKAELLKELFQVNFKLSKIRRKYFESIPEMSHSEYMLLNHVIVLEEKDEKQTISQVAQELELSNAAVSRTIKQLLKKEWLFRETLEEDRRNGIIKISTLGRHKFNEVDEALNQQMEHSFDLLTGEEIQQFIQTGNQIIQKLTYN